MLFNRKNSFKDERYNGKRIGIIGLGPRNGTTHIAVAVSNFLSETKHKRVCLVEHNRHDDLSRLTETLEPGVSGICSYHRVTYIPSSQMNDPLYDLKYDCMVFDLGHDLIRNLNFLQLCDIKIAVGTDAPWRKHEYAVIKELFGKERIPESWRLFINLGNPSFLKTMDHCPVFKGCFPFEPDPVFPSDETIKFLEDII
jgi:hypothetical protein